VIDSAFLNRQCELSEALSHGCFIGSSRLYVGTRSPYLGNPYLFRSAVTISLRQARPRKWELIPKPTLRTQATRSRPILAVPRPRLPIIPDLLWIRTTRGPSSAHACLRYPVGFGSGCFFAPRNA